MSLTFDFNKHWPLLVSVGMALTGVAVFGAALKWDGLSLTVKLTELSGLLAPLAFASAVVERAVEIVVSPWRDADASKLEKAISVIKARPADPAADAQNAKDLMAASDRLDEYRGDTQQIAFGVSLTLSILVSMAGVRALAPFADVAKLNNQVVTKPGQHLFFLCVDVVLSAGLLAGGADGIHSVVNAVTSFFDNTVAKPKV
jgi:hypothetical protein